ncbi:hypothetical protein [Oricola sp.]|uniref:hypothetical protein n=1 Tax=Oricola sp. TaxID=1979950 RepID=UPI003BAA024E
MTEFESPITDTMAGPAASDDDRALSCPAGSKHTFAQLQENAARIAEALEAYDFDAVRSMFQPLR